MQQVQQSSHKNQFTSTLVPLSLFQKRVLLLQSRQTTSFNDFSIEAGILLRGNGVPHAMLDIHVLFVRGLPDAVVSQPTQLSLIPTPTHGPYLLQTLRSLSLTSLPSLS